MSLLGLIAAEQAKNKVKQGYTPLPEGANWFDTLETSLSNVPNVTDDMIGGLIDLASKPEARKQLRKSLSDFSLGVAEKINDGPLFDTELGRERAPKRIETVDQAIAAVKNTLSSERNIQEFLSQNPDVFAGGVWGAGKVGGFVAPKAGEMVEKHLKDIGGIKSIIPPDSKTFGKDDAYTSTEFMDLGKDVGDNLSDAAHKFRGDIGYMADPGYGKGISESSFVDLINQQGLAMKRSGVNNWEETMDLLQSKVGLDRMEEMLEGSAVVLEKPLYIERAEGFGGSKKTPVDVKDTSIYSATVVDPKNAALMNLKSPYGDNPYIVKLEAGTKIYHPGKNADLFEVVVRGKDVNKSQGIKKSDFKIKDERKLGDTLFNWDEIEKETAVKPKQTKALYHTSAKEIDIDTSKEPLWFALEEKHATDGWAKNIESDGGKAQIYKREFTGNMIKREDARRLFEENGLDFSDYEISLTENPTAKEVLGMKGTKLLKEKGFDGLEFMDYDPRDFQKDLKAAIIFEPNKTTDSSKKRTKPANYKQGLLDLD